MVKFLAHCLDGTNYATGEKGTPLDFVSFHAKGSPKFTKDGHVQMGIANQLRDMNTAFARFAKDPRTKDKPIIIGESDPEGCAACQGPQMGYRNGTMYSSYTAASFARCIELADKHGVNLEGVLTWAFEFEGYEPFAGFRVLASGEIDHPVLNVFRMYAQLKGDRVRATSSAAASLDDMLKTGVRGQPDVSALAVAAPGRATVMLWNYHDDDLPGATANIELSLIGLPAGASNVRVTEQRIDETSANSYTAWKKLGSPKTPTKEQVEQIQQAGKLVSVDGKIDGSKVSVALPRQGVSLITVQWDGQ
jgi:xylan 1,4-beta-xylosidase